MNGPCIKPKYKKPFQIHSANFINVKNFGKHHNMHSSTSTNARVFVWKYILVLVYLLE